MMNSTVASFQCDFVFTAVTVLGFECQTYEALSLIFMAGENAW